MRKGGFETFSLDDYEITKDGRVFSLKRGHREVAPQPNGKGYMRVHIAGKMRFVHRLVAEKYVPNPDGKPCVNHIDGNKQNNSASNLEWVTNAENRKHAVANGLHLKGENCPWAKLTQEDVDFIRTHREISAKELAAKYGVAVATVRSARNGNSWKHHG